MGPRLRGSEPCDRSYVRTRANVRQHNHISYTVTYDMQKYRRLSSSAESESGAMQSGTGFRGSLTPPTEKHSPKAPKIKIADPLWPTPPFFWIYNLILYCSVSLVPVQCVVSASVEGTVAVHGSQLELEDQGEAIVG
jgi:hypothetical protein